ncbi:MAG TPA: hypothetical protein VGM96_23570 [Reyranella sp.]|jgi:hypothetical protein
MAVAAALLALVGLGGLAFASDQLRALGGRYMVAVLFVTALSLLFLALTWMRSPVTPLIVTFGLALWVAYRLCLAIASGNWPLVVDVLGEGVLAAGFCGYMLTGSRPSAYYRQRT